MSSGEPQKTYRKKLIEVSLPLEAINQACQIEKFNPFLKGHPRSVHHWWARRPLAACRAVIFSSLVDDPSEYMPDEKSANEERERLFKILEDLVLWENINNEDVLDKARLEIARSIARNINVPLPIGKDAIQEFLATKAPPVMDPFAGGGSIPLEAQRLGLRAYASDLNPVAVLINKALIEIPPSFAGMRPTHPVNYEQPSANISKNKKDVKEIPLQKALWERDWKGAQGLAEDIRFYGQWMLDKAEKRIRSYYPKFMISSEVLVNRVDLKDLGLKPGDELVVDTWIWTRTVVCPNPACKINTPLIKSIWLSTVKGKKCWIQPSVRNKNGKMVVEFNICIGEHDQPTKSTVGRSGAFCVSCNAPIPLEYIRTQGKESNLGIQMLAVVAKTKADKRVFLAPTTEHELLAKNIKLKWSPEESIPYNPFSLRPPLYGLGLFSDLFTKRQLLALTTFCDLAVDVKQQVLSDFKGQNSNNDDTKAQEYANALVTYLAMAISQLSRYSVTICTWNSSNQNVVQAFARQAIPMTWDFAETNILDGKLTIQTTASWVASAIENIGWKGSFGFSESQDSAKELSATTQSPMIVTDPPYYDNIGYADLSDFFYVWLRPCLQKIYPEIFSTVLTPKTQELVASPYRFGGDKNRAEKSFLSGLGDAFDLMQKKAVSDYPTSIFYAYKQTEEVIDSLDEKQLILTSTGWETMLGGLLGAGYMVLGTWPMRTERPTGTKVSMNALASSIVLVCRPRPKESTSTTRRDYLSALKREMIPALRNLQLGNIAPVDLAQAAIGPGMAIFSRYKSVLEADGSQMDVRSALALINQSLDEHFTEQEGEFDSDTRWALAWFEQYGHEQGPYGVAETLSKAKNTSVEGLTHSGFLEARGGKVRLLRRDGLDENWDPTNDNRLTAWEAAQYLIRVLDKEGEKGAGALLDKLGSFGEIARDLSYRLFTICERKSWAQEALAYNMLVVAWPRIKEQAGKGPRQEALL